MDDDRICNYLVLKLLTTVDIAGETVKLHGCSGYLPVFDTLEGAEACARGKYQIVPIYEEPDIISPPPLAPSFDLEPDS